MKLIFFLFLSLLLFSCRTTKENGINSDITNIEKVDTVSVDTLVTQLDSDGDGLIDSIDKCPYQFGGDSTGCPEIALITYDNREEYNKRVVNEQQVIKRIEKHENKTKLKVIDRTSKSVSKNDSLSGWIAYSVPEQMKVAKSYSVKVRISKKQNGQTKADLILGNSDAINNPQLPTIATIEDVRVSGEMSAELRADAEAFDIKALSTPFQNIDNESYTEWEWVVTPKKSGDSPLKLVIKVKDLNKDIVVFNKNIQIQKNVSFVVEGFFEKYWQWFMTTIIIPVFIYFWNRKKKRKQKKS